MSLSEMSHDKNNHKNIQFLPWGKCWQSTNFDEWLFKKTFNLKSISESTIWKWMKINGFNYCERKKILLWQTWEWGKCPI